MTEAPATETVPIERLVEDLSSDLEEVRKFAVIGLSQAGDLAAVPHLERMTQDPSPSVRYFARVGLDKMRRSAQSPQGAWEKALDDAAGDDVDLAGWRRMLSDPEPTKRLEAALATMRLVDPAIYVVLEERLRQESDPKVLATLVRAVARFRRPESFDPLRAFLAHSENRVRANAVEALDELGDPRVLPLIEPLLQDSDNRTRGNAIRALARFDKPRALSLAGEMGAAPEVWLRATAIWLLKELGGDDAARFLRAMLRKETGELVPKISAALEAVAEKGSAVARAALDARREPGQEKPSRDPDEIRKLLRSDAYRERMDAIPLALELPREAAIVLLREQLATEDHPFVIATLVKAMGRVGGPKEVELLGGFLKHPDARVRANTIEGLAFIGLPEVYPLVEPMLEDANNRVKANAARVMATRDSERAFATLREMLLSPDPMLAGSALHALKEIGTDQILEILEIGLSNRNQEMQLKVLKVLELLGKESALARAIHEKYREKGGVLPWTTEPLQALLLKMNDADPKVRLDALEKLAPFPDARARNRVRLATRDRDRRVRERALEIVGESDLEERRRGLLANLGLAAYKKMKAHPEMLPELAAFRTRIAEASDRLDRGEDVVDSISMRREQLLALGQRVASLAQSGAVKDADLQEICRQLVSVDAERERRRIPVVPPARPPLWESIPPALWGVAVLGVLLFATLWLLSPADRGPVAWQTAKAPQARLSAYADMLLAAEPGGRCVAYRKRNGAVLWEASPGRREMHAPVAGRDIVYVAGDGGTILGYRMETGEQAFSVQLQGQISAPPQAELDSLYVLVSSPPSGASVMLLDPLRGTLTRKDDLGAGEGQALLITATAEIAILGERVVALERATGKKLWEYRAEAPCLAVPGPLEVGERIVVASGKQLLGLDQSGRLVWSQTLPEPEPFSVGPFLSNSLLLMPSGSRLHVFAAQTGAPVSGHDLGKRPMFATSSGERFIHSPEKGTVVVLFLGTGRSAILSGIPGDIYDLTADGETIFASTTRGLLALRIPASP